MSGDGLYDVVPADAVTVAAERAASVLRRDLPQYMPDARLRGVAFDAAYEALAAAAPAIAERAADPVYRERDQLVAALSKLFPAHFANHDDVDWDDDWRNIVCIHLPTGQVTWHIHVSEVPLFGHLTIGSNHWDGHDTDEKYRRLSELDSGLLGGMADGAHPPGGAT